MNLRAVKGCDRMRRSITEYPTNGHKRSLREIAVELESAGFVTRRGTRYGGGGRNLMVRFAIGKAAFDAIARTLDPLRRATTVAGLDKAGRTKAQYPDQSAMFCK